jgi:tripartite-type tricarboxylate transporter receptor subunit TctC
MQRSLVTFVLGIALTAAMSSASAQTWPQRPVKFVVSLGPGSAVDIGARLLAERLTARWGQPVVVENRPGGDGVVAITSALGARDDHVLLESPTSSFTAHPFLHDKMPYKMSDLAPIASVTSTIVAIAVPKSLNVNSFDELLAMARAQPGKLNYAGATGAFDFMFDGFLKSANIDMAKVPYRNVVEALSDVGENRVQMFQGALAIAQPQLQAGKVKLLAVMNSVRAPAEPEVPTIAEAGHPELTLDGLVGFFTVEGLMSAELRERISADIRAAAVDPTILARLTVTGQLSKVAGPAEFAAAIDEQRAKVAASAKTLGLKAAE